MEQVAEEIREIGGKRFRLIASSTLQHHIDFMCLCKLIGLADVQRGPQEEKEQFAIRVHWLVMNSGRMFDVLGFCLIPEKYQVLDWTPKIAAQTSEFFRKLTDMAEWEKAKAVLVELDAFFAYGRISSEHSHTASMDQPPGPRNQEPPVHLDALPSYVISESGAPSSGNSPDTTPASMTQS